MLYRLCNSIYTRCAWLIPYFVNPVNDDGWKVTTGRDGQKMNIKGHSKSYSQIFISLLSSVGFGRNKKCLPSCTAVFFSIIIWLRKRLFIEIQNIVIRVIVNEIVECFMWIAERADWYQNKYWLCGWRIASWKVRQNKCKWANCNLRESKSEQNSHWAESKFMQEGEDGTIAINVNNNHYYIK